MNIIDRFILAIQKKFVLWGFKNQINKVINQNRLAKLQNGNIRYIDKSGKQTIGSLNEITSYMIDKSRQMSYLTQTDVGFKDLENIIEECCESARINGQILNQQELVTKLAELGNRPKGISYANRKIIATLIKQLRKKELPPKQLNKLIKVYEKVEKEYQNNLRKEENKK